MHIDRLQKFHSVYRQGGNKAGRAREQLRGSVYRHYTLSIGKPRKAIDFLSATHVLAGTSHVV